MFRKSGDVIVEAVISPTGEVVKFKNEFNQVVGMEQPYLGQVFSHEKLSIYVVDGPYVRRTYSMDFNVGGHGFVYDFIPKDEVWLDSSVEERELQFSLVHELVERTMMMDEHNPQDYETAHRQANTIELELRKENVPQKVESTLCTLIEAAIK
jgi:hypothetical protein